MSQQQNTALGTKKTGLDKQAGELIETKARGQQAYPLKKDVSVAKADAVGSTANAFWIGCRGAWHMTGATGKGIYEWGDQLWDTSWTFHDSSNVGSREGWTYKEDGYEFYMFFGQFSGQGDCSGDRPFQLMYSHDNVNFNSYDCTI